MQNKGIEIFDGKNFGIVHKTDNSPNQINFKLHNHDDLYEVVLLLNGDCEFCVEGNVYKLGLHDIVFTRPFELHHIVCLSEKVYDRIIIYIEIDYFKNKNCLKFLNIFENRGLGIHNLIVSDIADTVIIDCITRLYSYCHQNAYDVADNVLYEFLYLINEAKNISENFYTKNERVRDIILYINNHLTEDLCLDTLQNKFFTPKQYMCKMFKKNTGYTINKYINYKRILLAQQLHRSGQSLLQASLNAGFHSYSNFYKNYLKQFGTAPKSMN